MTHQPSHPPSPAPTYHSTFPPTKPQDLQFSPELTQKPSTRPKPSTSLPISTPLPPRPTHTKTKHTTLSILHCALTATLIIIVTIYTTFALGVNLFGALHPQQPITIVINGAGADDIINTAPGVVVTLTSAPRLVPTATSTTTLRLADSNSNRDPGTGSARMRTTDVPRVTDAERVTETGTAIEEKTTLITVTRRGG